MFSASSPSFLAVSTTIGPMASPKDGLPQLESLSFPPRTFHSYEADPCLDMDLDDSVYLDELPGSDISEALLPPYSPAYSVDSRHPHEDSMSHTQPRTLEDEPEHLHSNLFTLGSLQIQSTLGCGTFGRVLLVRHSVAESSRFFALKILPKQHLQRRSQLSHVRAERYILSRVHHPFVVQLFATFQDSINLYMLMEYCPGGELFSHLRRARSFTTDVTRFYLANIVLALKYLHSYNIVYRDLKPENLLLDSRGYLCLTDFGFSKVVDDRTWTLCGTPEYLAPEIIQNDGHGKAADWWACGILAYEMLVGHSPFVDNSVFAIYEKILAGHVSWPPFIDHLSKGLIRAFLMPDLSSRLGNLSGGTQDVLDHPWFHLVDWNSVEKQEIMPPIIPHISSPDDTRHFPKLPLPDSIPRILGGNHPVPDSLNTNPTFEGF